MKEGNLSPPVLAKNKGTEVFRLVSAAKAKLARACPISCLYCIGANAFNEHSPSLRRGELSESVSTFQIYSPGQILIFFLYIFSSSFEGYPQFLPLFLKNHARGRKGRSNSKKNRRIRKAVS